MFKSSKKQLEFLAIPLPVRIVLTLSLLLTLIAPSVVNAQINFPLQVRVEWDPNAAGDNVTSYGFKIDSAPVIVVPLTACTASSCGFNFNITAEGPHTVVISATNSWGTQNAGGVTFTARAPAIVNVRRVIKVEPTPPTTPPGE